MDYYHNGTELVPCDGDQCTWRLVRDGKIVRFFQAPNSYRAKDVADLEGGKAEWAALGLVDIHAEQFVQDSQLKTERYAWPGGYSIRYLNETRCHNVRQICADCAHEARKQYALDVLGMVCEWCLYEDEDCELSADPDSVAFTPYVNWEGDSEYCDECNCEMVSEYGPIDE